MQTKTKLTVTIDSETLPRAKEYARAQGVSLSSIIEDALLEALDGEGQSSAEQVDWETAEARTAAIVARLDEETPEERLARLEDNTLPLGTRLLGQAKPEKPLTDEELDDLRYEHLRRKYG